MRVVRTQTFKAKMSKGIHESLDASPALTRRKNARKALSSRWMAERWDCAKYPSNPSQSFLISVNDLN